MREYVLPNDIVLKLRGMYEAMYGSCVGMVTQSCVRSAQVSFYGVMLSSSLARTDRGSCVSAHWVSDTQSASIDTGAEARAGFVQYYLQHNLELRNQLGIKYIPHTLAFVSWFRTNQSKNAFGEHVQLWDSEFLHSRLLPYKCLALTIVPTC